MFDSFKTYGVFLVIALFVGTVLLSNKAGVNLTHHHMLPQLTQHEKIYCTGYVNRTCSVRLSTGIDKPETYREVLQLLADAKSGDVVKFYLIGQGGRVDSTIQLVNALRTTKAHTVAVVQGDVYSAHAVLAVSMSELQVGDHVLFLFHRSSAYGSVEETCARHQGKLDRTQDAYEKCLNYYSFHLKQDEAMVKSAEGKYLTPAELKQVLEGHDVIVTGEEMKKRGK